MLGMLLMSPVTGLIFVLREIAQAVGDARDADRRAAMAELQELHRLIEAGAIPEAEFEEREAVLLDKLGFVVRWGRDVKTRIGGSDVRPADPLRPARPADRDRRRRPRLDRRSRWPGIELIYIELSLLVASVETAFGPPEKLPALRRLRHDRYARAAGGAGRLGAGTRPRHRTSPGGSIPAPSGWISGVTWAMAWPSSCSPW